MTRPGPTARVLARKKAEKNAALAMFLLPPPTRSFVQIMSEPTTVENMIETAGRWRRRALEARRARDYARVEECVKNAHNALRSARDLMQ